MKTPGNVIQFRRLSASFHLLPLSQLLRACLGLNLLPWRVIPATGKVDSSYWLELTWVTDMKDIWLSAGHWVGSGCKSVCAPKLWPVRAELFVVRVGRGYCEQARVICSFTAQPHRREGKRGPELKQETVVASHRANLAVDMTSSRTMLTHCLVPSFAVSWLANEWRTIHRQGIMSHESVKPLELWIFGLAYHKFTSPD